MNDDEKKIPAEFWQRFSDAEWEELWETNGVLNAKQCARLWRIAGWAGKPWGSMQIMLNKADVTKAFPPKEERHEQDL